MKEVTVLQDHFPQVKDTDVWKAISQQISLAKADECGYAIKFLLHLLY